ncbi:D-glycero-D-manno-heptose 1,7-bisphosphate phosphatase [Saccharicrinis carchari]|uniref:D,D-heptose 1,7-bisphosphate phosphatase n=1 Tax=Saccharicrinis carchari TaxID=1168039 RepID=A0A521CK29_SACCC|nr:HAD family hydrolase [Saccharicrinis carchari]SMO59762.1 D-glycero-D-manno-heptose 1,7-bisphosphate phosphatase [Saccharicrinis carchari]
MNKAVFIDRDGVVNSDEGHYYVYRVEDFVFNPDIEMALSLLKKAGFKTILVTNQGGVAKGEYDMEEVQLLHNYMQAQLEKYGAQFNAIYVCPHHHSVSVCDCRKPKPGMIYQGIRDLNIDPRKSFLIGDADRDIQAGQAAGLRACFKVKKNSSILAQVEHIISISDKA